MHTSAGHGYCDCGDPEAWSSDFVCKIHSLEKSDEGPAASIERPLSEEMETRLYYVSTIACRFIANLVCWPETDSLPEAIFR